MLEFIATPWKNYYEALTNVYSTNLSLKNTVGLIFSTKYPQLFDESKARFNYVQDMSITEQHMYDETEPR